MQSKFARTLITSSTCLVATIFSRFQSSQYVVNYSNALQGKDHRTSVEEVSKLSRIRPLGKLGLPVFH